MNTVYILGLLIGIALLINPVTALIMQQAEGFHIHINPRSEKAPIVITDENIYITWWTNNTANSNEEIMFRASTDGGATFGDKINLSNTTNADSWRVEIESDTDSVVVT